jgi:hypothetical protein
LPRFELLSFHTVWGLPDFADAEGYSLIETFQEVALDRLPRR